MFGPFVHNIDPVLFSIGGVHFWWYGLSFTLGFFNAHLFLRRNRERVGLSLREVYALTIFLAIGILIGGRALVVINNEWPFYREHLDLIPAVWVGGMATHGLILGGVIGVLLFCRLYKVPFRPILDLLAVSAAIILGFGRIGNFIDGQIFGSLTDLPWAVQFPATEGFRHPVVLYDGLKNFLLVPTLIWLRRFDLPPGRLAVIFVILYAGLRIPIDTLREYPISMWGVPTGQMLNIIMLGAGLIAMAVNIYRSNTKTVERDRASDDRPVGLRRFAFMAICLFPLIIPSDATRDVPVTYGQRHAGLVHSALYPRIGADLAQAAEEER
jgi:phosphatidylglycerol---prolipoprotein diacylglyceryl transferase